MQGNEIMALEFFICVITMTSCSVEDFPHSAECSWSGKYAEGSKNKFKDS